MFMEEILMADLSSPRNRRLARRFVPKRSTRVVCLKGRWGLGRSVADGVLDLSESGVRLRLKEPLIPGQEVEVSLEGAQVPRPVRMEAVVMWCIALDDSHLAGVRFEKLLPFSVLQALSAS